MWVLITWCGRQTINFWRGGEKEAESAEMSALLSAKQIIIGRARIWKMVCVTIKSILFPFCDSLAVSVVALKYVFRFSDISPLEEWSVIILSSSMGWTQWFASNEQERKCNEKVPLWSVGPKRQCHLLALCWTTHWEAHYHAIRTLTQWRPMEWGTEASSQQPSEWSWLSGSWSYNSANFRIAVSSATELQSHLIHPGFWILRNFDKISVAVSCLCYGVIYAAID